MQIREVMTRGVESARPDTTVQEAATRMRDLKIGTLPVCGEHQRLVGMVTDRDITTRCVAEGRDPVRTTVEETMTRDVISCYEDDDVREAAELMRQRQVRRLVVLDRTKKLVGIISLGDLAVETHDEKLAGATLEQISKPVHPVRFVGCILLAPAPM